MKRATLAFYLVCLTLLLITQTGLAADLNGKWDLEFMSDQGERHYSATLRVEEGKVTGTFGPSETPVRGTFVNGQLELKFPFVTDDGSKDELKISGKLDGEKLTGTWDIAGYSGSFVGKRSK